MYNCTKMVEEMCKAFEHPVHYVPTIPNEQQQRLRPSLCKEETKETNQAFEEDDLTGVADGLADTVVVVVGSYLAFGLEVFEPIWTPACFEPTMPKNDEKNTLIKLMSLASDRIQQAFVYLDLRTPPHLDEIKAAFDMTMGIVQIVAYRCGIDFMPVFREVNRSNMSKVVNGKVLKNEHGKVIKPEGYTPPNVAGELERQRLLFNK